MVYCNFLWQAVAVDDTGRIASGTYHVSSYKCSGCSCTVRDVSSLSQFLMAADAWTSVVPPVLCACRSKAATVHGYKPYELCSWTWTSQSTCPDTDGVKSFGCNISSIKLHFQEVKVRNYIRFYVHLKSSRIAEDIQCLHWYVIRIRHSKKINIWKVHFFQSCVCFHVHVCVCAACLSDGLPKMLPLSNTHVLQTWSVAGQMCRFSLRRTWPHSIYSLLVGSRKRKQVTSIFKTANYVTVYMIYFKQAVSFPVTNPISLFCD